MGIEKIKGKITSDAEKEAKKLVDSAKNEAKKISESNQKMVDMYKKKRKTEIEAEVKLYRGKILAQERIQAKRDYLSKREQIIEKYLKDALAKIDRKSKEYTDFMKNIVTDNIKLFSENVVLKCNKADVKLVKSLVKDGAVNEADIKGGIIFSDETKTIDESLDSIFDRRKNDLRQEVNNLM